MHTIAIVSDIHANLPALEAVLADARQQGAERIWCLGDIVGYGAQPIECLVRLRDLGAVMVKGNHEQAVLDNPFGFNALAAAAVRWTRAQLLANHGNAGQSFQFIGGLGQRVDLDSAVLVHGSPAQPIDEYIFREDTMENMPRGLDFSPKLARSFRLIDRPCFIGHTHIPGIVDADMAWTGPSDCDDHWDTHSKPCIVNVGSVGQPRDGDTRASYALYHEGVVAFRRVVYDVEAAAQRILDEPELPDPLAHRLLEGW